MAEKETVETLYLRLIVYMDCQKFYVGYQPPCAHVDIYPTQFRYMSIFKNYSSAMDTLYVI